MCQSLKRITFPDRMVRFGEWAFYENESLQSVCIPEGVTTIPSSAFARCHNLTCVIMPGSLQTICGGAFSQCHKLTDVTIPDGVTVIETGAFYCVCLKMVTAGALVGALVGAVIAAGAILTGGAAIGGIVAAIGSGALVGSISGKLLSLMPCICACLTKPNRWTMVKDTVLLQNQKALMPDAKLNCLLGGMVSIILPQIEIVLDALALSNCAYNVDDENSPRYKDNAEIPNGWTEIKDLEKEFGTKIETPLTNSLNGFKAKLFKNGDMYILAFAGTELRDDEGNFNQKDAVTDGRQAFGLDDKEDGQYANAVSLSNEISSKIEEENEKGDNKKLIITGHSLGGGLATIGGSVTGANTYTFNAAGVHEQTFKDQEVDIENTQHIQAYYSDKDPLNIVQNHRSILMALLASSKCGFLSFLGSGIFLTNSLPQVSGQKIGIETDCSLLSGHSLMESKLKETLMAEQKNTPDVKVYTEYE